MTQLNNNDDFWVALRQIMFDDFKNNDTNIEVASIIKNLNINKSSKVLDVACGFGRTLLPIQKKTNCEMWGIDSSKAFTDELKSKLPPKQSKQILHQDILDLDIKNYFDSAYNIFNSFGYFEDEDDNLKFLKKVYQALKPEGLFLLEMKGKELWARDFKKNFRYKKKDCNVSLNYSLESNFNIISNDWNIITKEKTLNYQFEHYIYSYTEISNLLIEAGFCELNCYGDWTNAMYDMDSQTMLIIAKK